MVDVPKVGSLVKSTRNNRVYKVVDQYEKHITQNTVAGVLKNTNGSFSRDVYFLGSKWRLVE